MPRREVAPPELPDVPFEALSAEEQARCIGWNLRLARKRAGYSQPAFIAHMRRVAGDDAVSLSYLGDIERGDRTPSLVTVLALAQALGVDPRSLFRLPDAPPPSAAGGASLEALDAAA